MTKGKRNFYLALLVIFTVATGMIVMRMIGGRYSVNRAEAQCAYIRITEGERQLLALLREEPEVVASFDRNEAVDAIIPLDLPRGLEMAAEHLPAAAEIGAISTHSRTVMVDYMYEGRRIVLTCNPRAVVEKTVAEEFSDQGEILLLFINDDNKTVTRQKLGS